MGGGCIGGGSCCVWGEDVSVVVAVVYGGRYFCDLVTNSFSAD